MDVAEVIVKKPKKVYFLQLAITLSIFNIFQLFLLNCSEIVEFCES